MSLKVKKWFFDEPEPTEQKIRLNLGCGEWIDTDCINGDKIKSPGVNIILDLERPLPFKDNSIDKILLKKVMAHIQHPIKLRKEIGRVLKFGGTYSTIECGCDSPHRFNKTEEYEKVIATKQDALNFIEFYKSSEELK